MRRLVSPRRPRRARPAKDAPTGRVVSNADDVLSVIRGAAAEVLGLPDADAVPADAPLTTLGIDSLMAVELRNRLAALLGRALPVSIVLQHPVPSALADRNRS